MLRSGCSLYVPDMPAGHPSANKFRNRTLRHIEHSGRLALVTCTGCGRACRYWAHDLIKVLGPDHDLLVPPFICSKCRRREWMDIRWIVPSATELQDGLTVRRPVKQVVRWIWRDEKA